jgi:hypothetical protein
VVSENEQRGLGVLGFQAAGAAMRWWNTVHHRASGQG